MFGKCYSKPAESSVQNQYTVSTLILTDFKHVLSGSSCLGQLKKTDRQTGEAKNACLQGQTLGVDNKKYTVPERLLESSTRFEFGSTGHVGLFEYTP